MFQFPIYFVQFPCQPFPSLTELPTADPQESPLHSKVKREELESEDERPNSRNRYRRKRKVPLASFRLKSRECRTLKGTSSQI